LFGGFNEGEVGEVLRGCVGCDRFVVVGPPRSGKTFFIGNHLRNNLNTNATIDEYTLGVPTAKTGGGSGGRGGVMGYLERMMPWIKKSRSKERVKDDELKGVLGNKGPKLVVEEAKKRIGNSPHRAYFIPWDSDEVRRCAEEPRECVFGADVGGALKLIKDAFEDKKMRIRWFRVEYIPPGLVKEVVDLVKEKGEREAEEVLKGWVDAYFEAIKTLDKVLGLGEDSLEWKGLSAGYVESFVNIYASYVIGGLAAGPMGVAALALIAVLTHMAFKSEAFKREGESYVNDIIELKKNLEVLREPNGEFNELGNLLVYRVAYAMGMSYDEAYEALKEITGLEKDELKKKIEEIGGRIKDLEKELSEVKERVRGLSAGVDVFFLDDVESARMYPTVRLANGELMVVGENGYHEIIRAGPFGALTSKVERRLRAGSLLVLTGPKGDGKSTLAAAAIWDLLKSGEVGVVLRVQDLPGDEKVEKFRSLIEDFLINDWKYLGISDWEFGNLLILYDPSGVYGQVGGVEAPSELEVTVRNIFDAVMRATENARSILGREPTARVSVLFVLSTDLYNAVSNDARGKLESYRLDASLNDAEFLTKLIMEYTRTKGKSSGCRTIDEKLSELAGETIDEKLSELAGELAKFDSGHALIARLIGEELARNNCSVGEVEGLIGSAKGKAKAFIILYINGLFEVHEDTDTAEALVKVFALRRPFVDRVRPGDPILTPGVVKLIGVTELSGWLARRQHDLIEEAIGKLLDCIVGKGGGCDDLGNALEPWVPRTVGILRDVSEKVSDKGSAVKYFVDNYGKEFTTTLGSFSNCWRRAALIIGYGLAGHVSVSRPEDLPEVAESLGDALRGCGVDDYLLVDNKTPPLIRYLTYTRVLTKAFIDKYDEAIAEINRILNIARDRGRIHIVEGVYGLGPASIIASAAGSGRAVEPSDADVALYIASSAMQNVVLPDLIMPILGALEPLRGKAPRMYLKLLAFASTIGNLDLDTVRYIVDELNKVLDNYGDRVKGHAPSLVYTIRAYTNLLKKRHEYFNKEGVRGVVGRVTDLLNELGRFKSSLGIIAWASALALALYYEDVRGLMEGALRIDVVNRANEVLGELNKLREKVQELMRDKEFMSYVESMSIKAVEKAVRWIILNTASILKHSFAIYRFNNDELDEAAKLFNEAAEESREIDDYRNNYLAIRSWALRVEVIEGSLVGGKLVDEFRQLYEEAFNEENFKVTAPYLSIASLTLGEYLVSLALTGGDEGVKKIKELIEEHLVVLNAYYGGSVLTRLMLNALLGPRGELSGELKSRLVVKPEESLGSFRYEMHHEFLPALMVTFGVIKPENGIKLCEEFNDDCIYSVFAVRGNSVAVKQLREKILITFHKRILREEKLNMLKRLGFDAKSLNDEFRGLAYGLDGKSLVQLLAPETSEALLALMLYALINGDEKLAKAYALYKTATLSVKLPARLFLDVYRACEKGCDLSNEDLRQAVTKLFLCLF